MDNVITFLDKLAEDKDLQAALMAATHTAATKEEKVTAITKVANEAGFAVTAEKLEKMVESIRVSSAKLTDDDLENVAGGLINPELARQNIPSWPNGEQGPVTTLGAGGLASGKTLQQIMEDFEGPICW